jgi:hypothetical protein
VNFLVIQERRNEAITLTANITDIEVLLRHVLSHVNFQLDLIEESVTADVASEFPQVHVDMLVMFEVRIQSFFVEIVHATNQTNEWKLMRYDMSLELVKSLKLQVASSTTPHWLLTVLMNLREMFLFLVFIGESFLAKLAAIKPRTFLLDVLVNAFDVTF